MPHILILFLLPPPLIPHAAGSATIDFSTSLGRQAGFDGDNAEAGDTLVIHGLVEGTDQPALLAEMERHPDDEVRFVLTTTVRSATQFVWINPRTNYWLTEYQGGEATFHRDDRKDGFAEPSTFGAGPEILRLTVDQMTFTVYGGPDGVSGTGEIHASSGELLDGFRHAASLPFRVFVRCGYGNRPGFFDAVPLAYRSVGYTMVTHGLVLEVSSLTVPTEPATWSRIKALFISSRD